MTKIKMFVLFLLCLVGAGIYSQMGRIRSVIVQREMEARKTAEAQKDIETVPKLKILNFRNYPVGEKQSTKGLDKDLLAFARIVGVGQFEKVSDDSPMPEINRGYNVKGTTAYRFEGIFRGECKGVSNYLPGFGPRKKSSFLLMEKYAGRYAGRAQYVSEKYALRLEYKTIADVRRPQCHTTLLVVPDAGEIYKERMALLHRGENEKLEN